MRRGGKMRRCGDASGDCILMLLFHFAAINIYLLGAFERWLRSLFPPPTTHVRGCVLENSLRGFYPRFDACCWNGPEVSGSYSFLSDKCGWKILMVCGVFSASRVRNDGLANSLSLFSPWGTWVFQLSLASAPFRPAVSCVDSLGEKYVMSPRVVLGSVSFFAGGALLVIPLPSLSRRAGIPRRGGWIQFRRLRLCELLRGVVQMV